MSIGSLGKSLQLSHANKTKLFTQYCLSSHNRPPPVNDPLAELAFRDFAHSRWFGYIRGKLVEKRAFFGTAPQTPYYIRRLEVNVVSRKRTS